MHLISTRSRGALAGAAAFLLLTPAAIAGPGEPPPEENPLPLGLVAGYGAGIAIDPPTRPPAVHPVAGPVDYGDAEASFGNERGRPHEGQDIFAPAGAELVSPVATTVLETGADGGRGNWAALYDARGDRTFVYFHMLEPAVANAGERLAPGDRVGEVGCTGSCYGDHLHFEIRAGKDPYGTPSDPLPELSRWERG